MRKRTLLAVLVVVLVAGVAAKMGAAAQQQRQPEKRHVQAMVIENLNVSLLGQSFLKRLDGYEMRDGVLTITWN